MFKIWNDFSSGQEHVGQCCSNFIWSLPRAGKWKIAKMVAVHWPRWPQCPYMVKTFKIFFSRTKHALRLNLCINMGDGRSTKVAKIMVIHWYLTFITSRSSSLPYACVWEKCWEFQTTSLVSLGECCSNFIWSLPGAGEWKIAKIVAIHWPRWLPCPYMAKTFQNLSPEQRMPYGWIFTQIIRDGRFTRVAKMMVVHWHLIFLWWG